MRVLDLFAGIGGFSLAAHWMGWETAAFVEWEPFCQKVLRKNFPNVPIYGDIKEFYYERERDAIGPVDIICGGPPCQPVSTAGKRGGRNDERWGWPEMFRVVRDVKPPTVVIENVAGLVSMDGGALLEEIFTDLESEGYAVQPYIIPAISVGAPHRRDRIWIVAHSNSSRGERSVMQQPSVYTRSTQSSQRPSGHPECAGLEGCIGIQGAEGLIEGHCQPTSNPKSQQEHPATTGGFQPKSVNGTFATADTQKAEREQSGGTRPGREGFADDIAPNWRKHWYEVATEFCRVDDGIPVELDQHGNRDNRAKRLKALGNAIVPQVAYEVFRAIQHQIYNQ